MSLDRSPINKGQTRGAFRQNDVPLNPTRHFYQYSSAQYCTVSSTIAEVNKCFLSHQLEIPTRDILLSLHLIIWFYLELVNNSGISTCRDDLL
jgi:hypothetical protein